MRAKEKAKRRWNDEKREKRIGRMKDATAKRTETENMADDETLEIAWLGGHEYRVFNQDGQHGMMSYKVDLRDGTCECEHGQQNGHDENSRACKHIGLATEQADSAPDTDARVTMSHIELVQQALSIMDEARTAQPAPAPQPASGGGSSGGSSGQSSGGSRGPDAEEKRQELQNALDGATNGMETQVYNGDIWVNKTPDAPDWTFSAFLSDPDQMQYDPDDGPGDYFSNYIAPGDVDEYISEHVA